MIGHVAKTVLSVKSDGFDCALSDPDPCNWKIPEDKDENNRDKDET